MIYRISALARGDPEDYAPIDVLMYVALKRCGGKFTGWKEIKKYNWPKFDEPVRQKSQPALFVVGLIFMPALALALYPRYRRTQRPPIVERLLREK